MMIDSDKQAMDLRAEMEAHKSLAKPANGDWIEAMDTATGVSCWYPIELYEQLRIAELRRRGIEP